MNIFSKLSQWYFSRKALPYWSILIIDCIIVYLSALFICTLNNSVMFTIEHFSKLCQTLTAYLVCYIIGFRIFHTYSGILRYSSFVDLQRMVSGVLIGMVLAIIAKYLILPLFPDAFLTLRLRSVIFWSFMAMLLMGCMRVLVKFMFDSLYTAPDAMNVFVYGIHRGGMSIAKSLRNQDSSQYKLAGFVTDDKNVAGGYLSGVKIYLSDAKSGRRYASAQSRGPFCGAQ